MTGMPKEGWCFIRPLKAPRTCRWCGKPMRLFRARAIGCEDCDQMKEWPNGKRRR